MRLKINPNTFQHTYQLIKSIGTKNDQPNFNLILLGYKDNLIKLSVFDGRAGYTIIENTIEDFEPGAACLDTEKFIRLLENSTKEVDIKIDDNEAIMKIGRSKYRLSTCPWQNFAKINKASLENQGVSLHKDQLLDIIKINDRYLKETDTPSPFSAIKIVLKDSKLRSWSCDTNTFSYLEYPFTGNLDIGIPAKQVDRVKKFISSPAEYIQIRQEGGYIFFSKPNYNNETLSILANCLDYPNIDMVFIQEGDDKFIFKFETKEFIEVLRRLLISSDQISNQIQMVFNDGIVKLSTKNSLVQGEEELEIENKDSLDINLNGNTLLEFVESLNGSSFNFIVNSNKNRIEVRDTIARFLTTPSMKEIKQVGKEKTNEQDTIS